jgi:hypothetical protein
MDDLKMLGRSEEDMENYIKIVKTISKDVNITFRLKKCAQISLKMVVPRGSHKQETHLRA